MVIRKGPKRGRLSAGEKAYIAEKAGKDTAESIAKRLNRPVDIVQRFMDKVTGIKPEARLSLTQQLESRPEWKQFQKQFNDDELEEFKHQYIQMVSTQFKDDLFPTEELQLFQVITLKILIDRTLTEQKMALDDMSLAHAQLQDLRNEGELADPQQILKWETIYDTAKKTNKECADRYKIYSDKQDKMFGSLKATRDQRVKIYENSKHSILGFVRLAMEEEQRQQMGEEMELMRIATEKEKARLSKPHQYDDKTTDQPLLTPETVVSA